MVRPASLAGSVMPRTGLDCRLSDGLGNRLPECNPVACVKRPEGTADQALFNRGKDRLDNGWFEEPCLRPVIEPHLAQARGRAQLAGHRHHHDIPPSFVIGMIADDDRGAPLGCALVGEGESPPFTSSQNVSNSGPDMVVG